MKPLLYLSLAFSLLFTACATHPPGDAQAVQGNWLPVSAELAGTPFTAAQLKSISLHLENGQYLVIADNTPDRGTYTIDETTPKGMTIVGTDGPNKGKTFPAIFEISGDTLRICYDLSGQQRPTEFKSTPGTQLFLVTYQRKKE